MWFLGLVLLFSRDYSYNLSCTSPKWHRSNKKSVVQDNLYVPVYLEWPMCLSKWCLLFFSLTANHHSKEGPARMQVQQSSWGHVWVYAVRIHFTKTNVPSDGATRNMWSEYLLRSIPLRDTDQGIGKTKDSRWNETFISIPLGWWAPCSPRRACPESPRWYHLVWWVLWSLKKKLHPSPNFPNQYLR